LTTAVSIFLRNRSSLANIIADAIKKNDDRAVTIIPKFEDIAKTVVPLLKKGDIVLTLGAGDITKAGALILDEIAK